MKIKTNVFLGPRSFKIWTIYLSNFTHILFFSTTNKELYSRHSQARIAKALFVILLPFKFQFGFSKSSKLHYLPRIYSEGTLVQKYKITHAENKTQVCLYATLYISTCQFNGTHPIHTDYPINTTELKKVHHSNSIFLEKNYRPFLTTRSNKQPNFRSAASGLKDHCFQPSIFLFCCCPYQSDEHRTRLQGNTMDHQDPQWGVSKGLHARVQECFEEATHWTEQP